MKEGHEETVAKFLKRGHMIYWLMNTENKSEEQAIQALGMALYAY